MNENLARAKEIELRQKFDEDDYTFKVEEDKGDPWWSGSLGTGVIPSGGPLHIPYSVGETNEFGKSEYPENKTKKKFLRSIFRFKKRR
ncbi:hypothetical protein [Alicyclobacillus suci]|uniref:hypothetical protein n=1 Tax=Alicyclobacillus suci TaxID=2816080 RepID=UPI001A8FE015|nr:hypothetical protein [Alicyclobacillus suci]